MADHPELGLATWLQNAARVDGLRLSDVDLAGLDAGMAEARQAMARLRRYDLANVDIALQPPFAGRR